MFLPFRGNSEVKFKPLCRTVRVYGEITSSEPLLSKYKYPFNFNSQARMGFNKIHLMIYVYKTLFLNNLINFNQTYTLLYIYCLGICDMQDRVFPSLSVFVHLLILHLADSKERCLS